MSWYEKLFRLIFPLRYHLEDEIEYLKNLLASQTRRADIAVEQLLAFRHEMEKKPIPKTVKAPIDPADLKGMGWESYQRTKVAIQERNNNKEKQNVES
jgi:hypothetical protein